MKLRGKKLEERASTLVVFERPSGPIVFELTAVLNTSDFDKIYPPPTPKVQIRTGGIKTYNTDDPVYKEALAERAKAYTAWLVMETLNVEANQLEWEKVDKGNPQTWKLWMDEMKESGLSDGEVIHLSRKVAEVNALNEDALEVARQSFLLGQAEAMLNDLNSQGGVQATT